MPCFDLNKISWLEHEKKRQIQKTLSNCIGSFHEDILSKVNGWEKAVEYVDTVNHEKKIMRD